MRTFLLSMTLVLTSGLSEAAQDVFTLNDDDVWLPKTEIAEGSPEAQLLEARRALINGDAQRAESLAATWLDRYEIHPLVPQAYLLRGDALVADDDEYEALFHYETIARLYPASDAFIPALQREYEIAKQYINGRKRKFWGIRWISAYDDAVELLIRIQERLPGSRLAELAGMELAQYYDRIGEKRLAADAYDLFIENYPQSEQISNARIRLIAAHLATYKGPQFDPAGLDTAKLKLQQLKVIEPAAADRVGAAGILFRIEESEAAKLLVNAHWYMKVRDPISAERTVRRLVKRYPRTVATQDALGLLNDIKKRLPQVVIDSMPDYSALLISPPVDSPADSSAPSDSAEDIGSESEPM